MKKVLVPMAYRFFPGEKEFAVHFARASYIKKLVSYKVVPLFVSSLEPQSMVDELYNLADGVLMMGGSDISPLYYQESPHVKTAVDEPLRDTLEHHILKKVLHDKKPYLGICRGCQSLAIASGGSLYQHIPEITKEHHDAHTYDELVTNPKHKITLYKDTKAYRILKTTSREVNSAHHQSIKEVGKHMKIAATSPDGIIEIIEHTDPDYFCFGVQSHPEVEEHSFFEPFFTAFFKAL